MGKQVDIYIEQVVLDGLPKLNTAQFSESLERELIKYVSLHELVKGVQQDKKIEQMDAGQVSVAHDKNPLQLGVEVATHVGEALKQ